MKRILGLLFVIVATYGAVAQPKGLVIDRTVAMVGGKAILLSEIESQFMQMSMQGIPPANARCALLEEMLFQKLMLNQADVDSIYVEEDEVELQLDRRIKYFVQQFGGDPKKMESYYGKSINEMKEEFRELLRDQLRMEKVRQSILESVEVSPSDVKEFFNALPSDSLPLIDSEYEMAHIVLIPKLSFEEKEKARVKIEGFKERLNKGEDFAVIAALYSEDPGSASKGGELGMFGRGVMAPEFEAAAFALKSKGEISPIVETQFGYHIIQMIERRGDFVNVRHILISPKISSMALYEASQKLDSIINLIRLDSLSFSEAARRFSEDENRLNKGVIVNPNTGNARHAPEEIDPSLFFAIEKLEQGQMTKVLPYTTETGQKAYRVVLLMNRSKPHKINLVDDYDLIQQYALRKKQETIINDWIRDKAAETYIKILDESYRDCSFNIDWMNNQRNPK
jgi:peptidyl-prolyl cis-trans isomerase SurA